VNFPIRFRAEVPTDIADACRWYDEHTPGLAESFLFELGETIGRIGSGPGVYAAGERQVRAARLHRFPYVVHYRFTGRQVVVLAVLHGARDPSAWEERAS
jgi:plasmid stabilization system protein ParE